MIYLFTALYCEAQIFIEQYHLKKVMESTRFQQFYQENAHIRLTVTGTGEIAASAAVSSVCTQYRPGQNDFLLNAGICAGISRKEGIFLVHKLTEQATGKIFYPDMLYRHGFEEAALISGMLPWDRGPEGRAVSDAGRHVNQSPDFGTRLQENRMPAFDSDLQKCRMPVFNSDLQKGRSTGFDADLYDMEAAAVYQAGAYDFAPHQMQFLKIISDCGEGKNLSANDARQCMEVYKDRIFTFLGQLLQAADSGYENPDVLYREEAIEKWCRKLSKDLHCSNTMEHILRQYIRYAALAEIDYEKAAAELYQTKQLPCKDKREGKRCFEALKQKLL